MPATTVPARRSTRCEKLTGLHINYLITLDFHAFKQIVDHLHGVYMNVDRRYYIPPNTGVSAINLQPGYQKLDGAQALSYVRYRHTDSDIYRTGRQQLFLDALKSRAQDGTLDLSSAPKLVGDLKHNVEIAKGGGGSVDSRTSSSRTSASSYGLPAGHLFRNAIPLNDFNYFVTPGGADVESASSGAIAAAVHSFLHPDVRVADGGQRPVRRHEEDARRRRRSSTSCRSRRSRCSSSTPAASRARPRTRRTA